MKIKLYALSCFLIASSLSFAQNDTLTVMQYNLTYYGNPAGNAASCTETNNNTTDKNANINTIINHVKPDVFGVNELGIPQSGTVSSSKYADDLMNNALNINGVSSYKRAAWEGFVDGGLSNMLYYNSDKLVLYYQDVVSKELGGSYITRALDVYTLYYKDPNISTATDTIFMTFIVAHLKAGSFTSDMDRRASATEALMNYLDNAPSKLRGPRFFMGDFNYSSPTEQSFQNLINPTNMNIAFDDPIDQIGEWGGNSSYASIHTQATRAGSNDNGGCFVTGGSDDRFDFILATQDALNPANDIAYVANSYKAIGQDGTFYNQDLKTSGNGAVPDNVALALYNTSDHMPVKLDLAIKLSGEVSTGNLVKKEEIFIQNPVKDLMYIKTTITEQLDITIYSITGAIVKKETINGTGSINVAQFKSGFYFVQISHNNNVIHTSKLVKE